jgi:hypothetical protein
MKDKTAMQQMLEWVRKTLPMDLDTPRMIEAKIESLLKVEKEQIKNACEEGFMWSAEGWNGEMLEYYKDGNETLELHKEEYYNETYANDTTKGLPEEDSKRRAWHY